MEEEKGLVEDNATKKHLTGVVSHNKGRYRQLGISSDFMEMKPHEEVKPSVQGTLYRLKKVGRN